jgi:hypothetical protein
MYAFKNTKSQKIYTSLFEELSEIANCLNYDLQPHFILTDFEKAAMNAITKLFPGAQNKACNFHLAQSVYRKIQSVGLSRTYGTDENFSLFMGHLPALAFFSASKIPQAFDELKNIMPATADSIIEWFEKNYVHRRIRNRGGNGQIRSLPLFPPEIWSVFENVEFGFPRTRNVEAWHSRWNTLVGKAHIGL